MNATRVLLTASTQTGPVHASDCHDRAMTSVREVGVVALTARANCDYYLSSFVRGTVRAKEAGRYRVHTHPLRWPNGNVFSDKDIAATQKHRRKPDAASSGFERNYLVGTDGRVYSFDGRGDQQKLVACLPPQAGP